MAVALCGVLLTSHAHATPTRCNAEAEQSVSAWVKAPTVDLVRALLQGRGAAVERYLKQGADASGCHAGASLLLLAAQADKWGSVSALLKAGAKVDAPVDAAGLTPLLRLAESGNFTGALKLLQLGADIRAVSPDGATALHHAAFAEPQSFAQQRDQLAFAHHILRYGRVADVQDTRMGLTALALATSRGNDALMDVLLSFGADVNIADKHGRTPLSVARDLGRQDLVDRLVQAGALDDASGWVSLSRLAQQGNASAFEEALQAHPAAGMTRAQRRAVTVAAMFASNGPALEALGRWGADMNEVFRFAPSWEAHPATLLSLALVYELSDDIVKSLLSAGADANQVISPASSQPPLVQALTQGRLTAAALLLDAGASASLVAPSDGHTPLMAAVLAGGFLPRNVVEPVLLRLLDAGVDVNASDAKGRTALRLAVITQEPWLVEALLKRHADPTKADESGETPLRAAQRVRSKPQLAQLFKASAAGAMR